MNAIECIVYSALQNEPLTPGRKITFPLEQRGDLTVEFGGHGPNLLPVVSVSFFDQEGLFPSLYEMRFEITDLGWFPFYFRNDCEGFEGHVYGLDHSGKVTGVDHKMKQLFIRVFESWNQQVIDYGIEQFVPASGGAV